LRAAIASVRSQTGIDPCEYEILVVDNAPEGLAANVVNAFPADSPRMRYVHELKSGPSHARNRAVGEARGELIAFLDDDETASPSWLASLTRALETTQADAAFGPVEAMFDLAPSRHASYAAGLYSRLIDRRTGADLRDRHTSLGTGNSIFRVKTCFTRSEPFPVEIAASGGEDTLLLRRLVKSGRRLVWAAQALAHEHVPPARAAPEFLRARRYRQGQLRSLACLEGPWPNQLGAGVWMCVGLLQLVGNSFAGAAYRLFGNDEARERAEFGIAGGLGKIVWWARSPTRYGPAADEGASQDLRPETQNFS
jgi:cellulose synthase/poly-beta-1,6-N-acetylglucosamine synthase-like glycosyltransferase